MPSYSLILLAYYSRPLVYVMPHYIYMVYCTHFPILRCTFQDDKRNMMDLDVNVIPVWIAGISGKGVVVTILDDGK